MADKEEFTIEDFKVDEFTLADFGGSGSTRQPDLIDRSLPEVIASLGRGKADFEEGEQNIFGNLGRPGAAIRAAIQNESPGQSRLSQAVQGFQVPEEVPSFTETVKEFPDFPIRNRGVRTPVGLLVGEALNKFDPNRNLERAIMGGGLDVATNPAEAATAFGGAKPAARIALKAFGRFAKPVSRSLSRFKADFINENLLPRAKNLFTKSVDNFTDGVKTFMKSKGSPQELLDHISRRGTSTVKATALKSRDSLDDVALNIEKGFDLKNQEINKLYSDALDNVGETDLINIDDAFKEITNVLKKNGFIDNFGNKTSIASAQSGNSQLRGLSDLHELLRPASGVGTTSAQRQGVGGVNKNVWQNIRDGLSKASTSGGESRITKDVVGISDKLHDQAVKSGLKGINKARDASREFFRNIDEFNKIDPDKAGTEKALSGIFNVKPTGRRLGKIDKYLKSNFSTQIKDIVSSRRLNDVQRQAADFIESGKSTNLLQQQLTKAVRKENFKQSKRFFKDLIGDSKELDEIFNDLKGFRTAQVIKSVGRRVAGTALVAGGGFAGARVGSNIFKGGEE